MWIESESGVSDKAGKSDLAAAPNRFGAFFLFELDIYPLLSIGL